MQFRHRFTAKVVGFVDLGLACISVVMAILALIGLYFLTSVFTSTNINSFFNAFNVTNENGHRVNATDKDLEIPTEVMVFVWIDLIISTIQFFASIALINSTSTGNPFSQSLSRAYIWVLISAIILVVYAIYRAVIKSWLFFGLGLIIRLILILFVLRFVGELRQAMTGESLGGGRGGTVIPNSVTMNTVISNDPTPTAPYM